MRVQLRLATHHAHHAHHAWRGWATATAPAPAPSAAKKARPYPCRPPPTQSWLDMGPQQARYATHGREPCRIPSSIFSASASRGLFPATAEPSAPPAQPDRSLPSPRHVSLIEPTFPPPSRGIPARRSHLPLDGETTRFERKDEAPGKQRSRRESRWDKSTMLLALPVVPTAAWDTALQGARHAPKQSRPANGFAQAEKSPLPQGAHVVPSSNHGKAVRMSTIRRPGWPMHVRDTPSSIT